MSQAFPFHKVSLREPDLRLNGTKERWRIGLSLSNMSLLACAEFVVLHFSSEVLFYIAYNYRNMAFMLQVFHFHDVSSTATPGTGRTSQDGSAEVKQRIHPSIFLYRTRQILLYDALYIYTKKSTQFCCLTGIVRSCF